jgi:hypothetical protein
MEDVIEIEFVLVNDRINKILSIFFKDVLFLLAAPVGNTLRHYIDKTRSHNLRAEYYTRVSPDAVPVRRDMIL